MLLLPARTYWIVVTRTGGGDDGLSVGTTSSEGAIDVAGMAGFSVGNNVWARDSSGMPDGTGGWTDYTGSLDASMKIRLRGSEATRPPGPYTTNRNQQTRAAAAETGASTTRYATSFSTRPLQLFLGLVSPTTWELTSVLLSVAAEPGVSPRVAIHADAGGLPAATPLTNGTLTAPANISTVLAKPGRAEFTASSALTLANNTRYWVILDAGSGSGKLSVSTTGSDQQDGRFFGRYHGGGSWPFGTPMKAHDGSQWSNDSSGRSFRMAINGTTDPSDGVVNFGLPQVGVGVTAEIEDVYGRFKNESWQWQRGETRGGPFTDIPAEEGGTSGRVYTPSAADLGKWLRAAVSYDNAFGAGKSASRVSDNAVLSQPVVSNAGQFSSISYALSPESVSEARVAQAFTTGADPSGYLLRGLRFGMAIETDYTAVSWALHADAGGAPAAAPLFDNIAAPADDLDADTGTFEELVHPGFVLTPDTRYWAVVTGSPIVEGIDPTLKLSAITEWADRVILDTTGAELDPGSASDWTLGVWTLAQIDAPSQGWVSHTRALELFGRSVLRMSVVTYPAVTASFAQASYAVDEGGTATVTVTLSADPERTVEIPLTATGQGGADGTDYSDVPTSLTFIPGQTTRTFAFITTDDDVDDDDESVKLAFGSPLPERVSIGSHGETTLHIGDNDDPPVEISFEQGSYTVPEAGTQTVRVTLDADPEREVTVSIVVTHQDGVTGADYSGVPESLVFGPVETEKTFDFSATQDDGDDDGESVILTFGNLSSRVSRGSHGETTLHIGDDDDPVVEVQFEHAEYGVFEGGDVTLAVVLSADPERTVTIPLTRTNEGGATDSDYSGVPDSVTFNGGETRKTFGFAALEDTDQEDGETVKLGFGTRPDRVDLGGNDEATVTIQDCEGGGIWCGTLLLEKRDGRPNRDLYASLTTPDEFEYNGTRYRVVARWLHRSLGTDLNTALPFRIPERSSFRLALDDVNGKGLARVEIPDDYLDWTLHFGDVELPFSEAKFCCDHLFRWYGIEFTDIFDAWQSGNEYQLRITRTPLADRVPKVLDPPPHVSVKPRNRGELSVSWVSPQLRNDGPPENATYKVQWKEISGSWDTPADVSEAVLAPEKPELWLHYKIEGLAGGVEYDVRVITTNTVGDSEPSNVATGRAKPDPDQAPGTAYRVRAQQPGDGRTRHQRHAGRRRDSYCYDLRDLRRGRPEQRRFRLPVGPPRPGGPNRRGHSGRDRPDLHGDLRRRRQWPQGAGHVHR